LGVSPLSRPNDDKAQPLFFNHKISVNGRNEQFFISVNNHSITVQEAIILHMNQEESQERDAREQRHTGTQRDIRDIKYQLDRLSGSVGELVTAFKGNDFGTEGIVEQMKRVMQEQSMLKKRLDDLELATAKKQRYLLAFVSTVGVVGGTIIKSIIDHFLKSKS
jgi:hypothetical protein